MKEKDKAEWFSSALNAALDAGKAIMKIYAKPFEVELKEDNSPLTIADREAHDIICQWIGPTMIPVMSEEGIMIDYEERKKWKLYWLVDPLDGTKEFIKKNGEFTVNIALIENGSPIFGVVFAPAMGVMYYAEKGNGAFKVIIPDLFSSHIDMHPTSSLPSQKLPSKFTIVGSRSHSSSETEAYVKELESVYGEIDFLAAGSSLKFCMVAEGKAQSYPRFAPTMEWDTAAGQIIVEEAGGRMVQWPSLNKFTYNREELRNGWFLATAGNSR
ncbi:MAG TPA: 3'(2'),5'-bisphosphate nucleotidase CysQ [Bacteroidia bacterium]|jgi:3'(2'), 5'-bisphosphate nucleotidase|nr:3'(2'),5'-bisphosphate nucleotidase CysQ [Bacteroidia bacterium]